MARYNSLTFESSTRENLKIASKKTEDKGLNIFENENLKRTDGVRARQKLKDRFFMQHFKVLQKNFGSYFERRKAEAFFIRILRPDLNDQKDHRYFSLF